MDEHGTVPVSYRRFALPICLVSLAFFGVYIVIILLVSLLFYFRFMPHAPGVFTFFTPFISILLTFLLVLSPCIGSILFILELRTQSLPWRAAFPLCLLSCVMLIPAVYYHSFQYFASDSNNAITLIYLGLLFLCSFMSLPAGVVIALHNLEGTVFFRIRKMASLTGVIGLIAAISLPISVSLINSAPYISWIVAIICCTQILLLMPLQGARMFNLSRSLAEISPNTAEAGTRHR